MRIPARVKQSYKDDSVHKYVKLHFPQLNLDITNEQIYSESMSLSESLMDRSTVEFVGCISSCFKIKVHNLKEDVKGKRIVVTIWTEDTTDYPIKLFDGIVDSVVRDSNKRSKQITAYDKLYEKGNVDVASWYQGLSFPITLKNLRNSLFNYLGINQVGRDLPNDNITISKIYDPKTLQSLTVIKSICQINGAMGIINRDGNFEYRIISDITVIPYPSIALFPSNKTFPATISSEQIEAEVVSYYRTVDFEDYEVQPVDKVKVRDNEEDVGVSYGTGNNAYIVQNNMFAKKLDDTTKTTIAHNIYDAIHGVTFTPFSSKNNGFPWIECGADALTCQVYNYDFDDTQPVSEQNPMFINKEFYILNREISGSQALVDQYTVKGDEYQSEFITDLNANVDMIKESSNYDTGRIDGIYNTFGGQEVMIVVDWNVSTGVLQTSSTILS